ncbi:MAG TPA: KEOPS complex subunit Cgi121 [Thermoplasmata archaeon]|nr:KEOPS complex subunit Cgi121 [Thermoplasmata archaeon]
MVRKKSAGRSLAKSAEGLEGIGFGGFRLDSSSAMRVMASDPELQVAKASMVFGLRHLGSAVLHARRAHAEKTNRAHDLRTEFLLCLTGQRQVGDALRVAGLGTGREEVVAVHFGGPQNLLGIAAREGWDRDDSLIEADVHDLKGAGFTAEEIATAIDPLLLPLERTALLTVQR